MSILSSSSHDEVTREQLNACSRIIHENTHEVFYRVKSAHTDADYTVRWHREEHDGVGRLTCTCRAGQEGIACWHKRAALAHDAWVTAEQAAATTQPEEDLPTMSTTTINTHTTRAADEKAAALDKYHPREHLIKIRAKDGSLREYLPAAWRLYELSLRFPDANFATEVLYFNVEHNFCIVRCRLYLGADYEFSQKKVEACKSGPLSSLDKIETAAQARCCRLFGIGTEYALESDTSGKEEEAVTAATQLPSTAEEEEKENSEVKLQNNSVVTLKSVKAAVHKVGLAHNREQWSLWKRAQLGKDVADEQLTQEQIALLYNGTVEHIRQLKKVS